ncbi:MAG: ferric reductase-like transmembrane domain-containing protein [Anaerolineales bacterium]|nr:ferric reductase-like transmembrane domain-containing protein [Anaerolineales bacterium]
MKTIKTSYLQAAMHIGAWLPLVIGVWDFFQGNLGPDPIREATLRTGKTALVLLVLSLACTPLNTLFKFKAALKLRRPLGLYAFMYASLHFAIFIGVDYFFDFSLIQDALLEKGYALLGFGAGLILLLLALTSTRGMQRRLKKNWKRLHRLVYLAGILAVVHYIWLVKQGVLEPWLWAALVLLLLLLRWQPIKQRLLKRAH